MTTIGNKFTTKVKETEDNEEKLKIFKLGVQEAIRELINISFERSDINDLIAQEPEFRQLQHFDATAVFSADMDSLQMGQVLSLISNLQCSVDNISEKIEGMESADPELTQRLLEVRSYYIE